MRRKSTRSTVAAAKSSTTTTCAHAPEKHTDVENRRRSERHRKPQPPTSVSSSSSNADEEEEEEVVETAENSGGESNSNSSSSTSSSSASSTSSGDETVADVEKGGSTVATATAATTGKGGGGGAEQTVWQVATKTTPTHQGEIQKLKLCLTRSSTETPVAQSSSSPKKRGRPPGSGARPTEDEEVRVVTRRRTRSRGSSSSQHSGGGAATGEDSLGPATVEDDTGGKIGGKGKCRGKLSSNVNVVVAVDDGDDHDAKKRQPLIDDNINATSKIDDDDHDDDDDGDKTPLKASVAIPVAVEQDTVLVQSPVTAASDPVVQLSSSSSPPSPPPPTNTVHVDQETVQIIGEISNAVTVTVNEPEPVSETVTEQKQTTELQTVKESPEAIPELQSETVAVKESTETVVDDDAITSNKKTPPELHPVHVIDDEAAETAKESDTCVDDDTNSETVCKQETAVSKDDEATVVAADDDDSTSKTVPEVNVQVGNIPEMKPVGDDSSCIELVKTKSKTIHVETVSSISKSDEIREEGEEIASNEISDVQVEGASTPETKNASAEVAMGVVPIGDACNENVLEIYAKPEIGDEPIISTTNDDEQSLSDTIEKKPPILVNATKKIHLKRQSAPASSSSIPTEVQNSHGKRKKIIWPYEPSVLVTALKMDLDTVQTWCLDSTIEFPAEVHLNLTPPSQLLSSDSTHPYQSVVNNNASKSSSTDDKLNLEQAAMDDGSGGGDAAAAAAANQQNIIAQNRKISIVEDTASKLQPPPSPAKHPASNVLFITNLVRPFTLKQLKELLARTGVIHDDGLWTDKIKSKCYVQYESQEDAEATRNALHGVQWPIGNGKKLIIEYATVEDMEKAKMPPQPSPQPPLPAPELSTVSQEKESHGNHIDLQSVEITRKVEVDVPPPKVVPPVREWDIGKKPVVPLRDTNKRGRSQSPSTIDNNDYVKRAKVGRKMENETPLKLMDELFLKTKASPSIFWQPLSPEEIQMKQHQRMVRMEAHRRRIEESEKNNISGSSSRRFRSVRRR